MIIMDIQCLRGRNIYSHKPVMKLLLDIGELYKEPTNRYGNFNERLLEMFPGLKKHFCSTGYEGGFAERLVEGTYVAHVTEHLILEMQSMAGYELTYGRTRIQVEPSIYSVIFQYEDEGCAMECARAAVEIIGALAEGLPVDHEGLLKGVLSVSRQTRLGPSTRAIYEEAVRRGIPVARIGNGSLLRLGLGKHSRVLESSLPDSTSCISADMAGDKQLTKQLLGDHMIPVPEGEVAYNEEMAMAVGERLGYPVVVKPLDSNQGKGVTLGIRDREGVRRAFREAAGYSRAAIVEKHIRGRDFRILVTGNRVSAVAERKPPSVTGDGRHTIGELVEMENRNPLRGEDHEKPLTRIRLDEVAKELLMRKGMNPHTIPQEGEMVHLRENGNLSTGGNARDCTGEIHAANCEIAVRAAKIMGLDIAGIDMTAEDIGVPVDGNNGAVIEVNAAPGLRMHLMPTLGKPRNVAGDILDLMFPQDKPVSIPVISITGTNGKTTTTRLIRHTLAAMGWTVGMTSTSGIYVGDDCIQKGDTTGALSARLVLAHKSVEAAVLETARGGMVRRGLGYDLADVGVVVNISEDHIGADGIHTLEDMAYAKALVVEAIKPDGHAVLNADDPMTGYLLKRVVSKVLLFSRDGENPMMARHLEGGGKAVITDGGMIYLLCQETRLPLMEIADIPITYGGRVECNIENSLAAISALYALDIPIHHIRKGLRSFMPDVATNPGRFNIFQLGDFKVMLDYCHNTAGFNAVLSFIRKLEEVRLVGVIGMPGDRLDRNIREVGELLRGVFDKVYIKEDGDLRGRMPGKTAGILYDALTGENPSTEEAQIIHSEVQALDTALWNAKAGDLIVMFYENFEGAMEVINRHKKRIMREKQVRIHGRSYAGGRYRVGGLGEGD